MRMLAEVAARLGRYPDAAALLERALELAPGFIPARHNYAFVLHRAGKSAEALTEVQRLLVLGYPSRSTYHNWCKLAREHGAFTLDVDVLTRISAVFGIHQALGILFPQERLGVDWLRSPHNAVVFGGHPPLDLITNGTQDGLLSVRRFLDGARGGLYMQPNTIDEAFTPYDDTEIVFR